MPPVEPPLYVVVGIGLFGGGGGGLFGGGGGGSGLLVGGIGVGRIGRGGSGLGFCGAISGFVPYNFLLSLASAAISAGVALNFGDDILVP